MVFFDVDGELLANSFPNSVLAGPTVLPGFWIFMYRVSPFTYLISAMLSTSVRDTTVSCAANEFRSFTPPPGQTCYQFMEPYINEVGGYLSASTINATDGCSYCAILETNKFLEAESINPKDAWRNFGIIWAYIAFNVVGALGLYWLARVPKKNGRKVKEEQTSAPSSPGEATPPVTGTEKA